jgi:hypothetical protein
MKIRGLFGRKVLIGVLAAAVAAFAAVVPVTSLFQLDGDATQGASGPDDWQTVNSTGGASTAHTGVVYDPSSFSGGSTVTDPTTFVQGSKDTDDISSWKWAGGSIPPKDDIVNSYAAAYNNGGNLVITFGADRFANNGSAQLGFWFLQGSATAVGADHGSFTGNHVVGDLLILVNFNQGGGVPSIDVLKWVGGRNPLLDVSGGPQNAVCGAGVTTVCAITNANPVDLFWPSAFKFPAATACAGATGSVACAPPVSFFEGAIDVTALLGAGNTPCISSFLAETRSSTSVTASLEDFSLHSFNVCGITISKTCPGGSVSADGTGFTFSYKGSVTNAGFGALNYVVVTDTYPITTTTNGTATYTIGTLAAGATAYFPGPGQTDTASFNSSVNGATNSASVAASAGSSNLTKSTTAQCPTVQVSPSLSLTKLCHVTFEEQGSNVVTRIDFNGVVQNQSNVQLTNVTVTDDPSTAVTLSSTTLPPKGHTTNNILDDFATYSGHYYPNALPTNTDGRYTFSDQVTANATSALGGAVTPQKQGASCPVCGVGVCSITQNP